MSAGKTVMGAAGANAVAQGGTSAALPVIPFLEVPLWYWNIGGVDTVMTPQALVVVLTGVLSIIALVSSIFKKGNR